jgi:potassium-transporting ATPase KdpC subunit
VREQAVKILFNSLLGEYPMSKLWIAFKMTVVLTLLTGVVYPFVVAGASWLLFPWQAQGSLVTRDGKVVGSALIGQNFSSPRYFQTRPSAAGDKGYDASNSSGSNLGPTNKVLIDTARTRLSKILEVNPGVIPSQVPIDLITASGSGLDPEISPAAAELQIRRVAAARGMKDDQVRALVDSATRHRWGGVLGEPGVNVLSLNLALDQLNKQQAEASRRKLSQTTPPPSLADARPPG